MVSGFSATRGFRRAAIFPTSSYRPFRGGVTPAIAATRGRSAKDHFAIDKVEEEKKFDGIFVLRTNTSARSHALLQAAVDDLHPGGWQPRPSPADQAATAG